MCCCALRKTIIFDNGSYKADAAASAVGCTARRNTNQYARNARALAFVRVGVSV
jgi:hypothetical protein